jgi:hypothetical protein
VGKGGRGFQCVKDLKTALSYALPVSVNMRASRTESIPRFVRLPAPTDGGIWKEGENHTVA